MAASGFASLSGGGGGGGGPPTGPAGGDLSGTYPDPEVRSASDQFQLRSTTDIVLSANVDNWNIGPISIVNVQTDTFGSYSITSIDNSGWAATQNTNMDGMLLILQNVDVSFHNITLVNLATGAIGAQFKFSTTIDELLVIAPFESVLLTYSVYTGYWMVSAVQQSGSSGGPWTLDADNNLFSNGAGNPGTMSGTNNFFGGTGVGTSTTTGGSNVGVGVNSLNVLTEGQFNVSLGVQGLVSLNTGSRNTVAGRGAASQIDTGSDNVAIGYLAGFNWMSGNSSNIAIGHQGVNGDSGVIRIGTLGTQKAFIAGDQIGIGTNALLNIGPPSTGVLNVAVGLDSQQNTTDGSQNCSFGPNTLVANTTSSYNTAIGNGTLTLITTNSDGNTALGNAALQVLTAGSNNTAIGQNAGILLDTGSDNITIGNQGVVSESGVIRIGTAGTHTNANIAGTSATIGDNTNTTTGNSFVLGTGSTLSGTDISVLGSNNFVTTTGSTFESTVIGYHHGDGGALTGDEPFLVAGRYNYVSTTTSGITNSSQTVVIGASNGSSIAPITGENNYFIGNANSMSAAQNNGFCIGFQNTFDTAATSFCFGAGNAVAAAANCVVIGVSSDISGSQSAALGYNLSVTGTRCTLIGNDLTSTDSDVVILGSTYSTVFASSTGPYIQNTNGDVVIEGRTNTNTKVGVALKAAYYATNMSYNVDNTDYTIDCTNPNGAPLTITLPTAVGIKGQIYVIKLTGNAAADFDTATIAAAAMEFIDGAATYALTVQYSSITVQSTGTGWIVI